jgi:maltose alpha-D-glucosyltransferase / alpha-amylase
MKFPLATPFSGGNVSASGAGQKWSLFEELRLALPGQLPAYLQAQRWFGGKARKIASTELLDLIPLPTGSLDALVLLVRLEYDGGLSETYVLPMVSSQAGRAENIEGPYLKTLSRESGQAMVLSDALTNDIVLLWLLGSIEAKMVSQGIRGEIRASPTDVFQEIRSHSPGLLSPKPLKGEQSNSSVIYGDRFILKLFRRVEEGVNPDLELGRFLTEKTTFRNTPAVAGSIEYCAEDGKLSTLGVLHAFVQNQGDAWRFTLGSLATFWQTASQRAPSRQPQTLQTESALDYLSHPPAIAKELGGAYLDAVARLGVRTAELHLALASEKSDPVFSPEPYNLAFLSDFEQSARQLTVRNYSLLRQKLDVLPREVRERAAEVLAHEAEVLEKFQLASKVIKSGLRTRIHGDYHLGQVLFTGLDFMIIDFEGEPARSLSERRVKKSPLQDVAGMVRSFHYAAFSYLLAPIEAAPASQKDFRELTPWADAWYGWVRTAFLKSYFETARSGSFLPESREEIIASLQVHLLEKAVYELGYELNNRPGWAAIPLAGISAILAR